MYRNHEHPAASLCRCLLGSCRVSNPRVLQAKSRRNLEKPMWLLDFLRMPCAGDNRVAVSTPDVAASVAPASCALAHIPSDMASGAGSGERSPVDAGLLLGRSFRVGWGPGGVIALPGAPPLARPCPGTDGAGQGPLALMGHLRVCWDIPPCIEQNPR